ncbi:hypothetical protein Pmar_PMAR008261 [Perkinsus marinus ATCC 50983]|uniref:Uncharacterized protein n=1 Tax=Perkinsus marinus (strain ATCC 50983 / TXsc) TaxID=423536 RepID=C5LES7_PERM5|nr:hypothetical protein Pmar_PMAR008261 [Perkinsus marinus ATCC 50983]EER04766.1 hypothetical protein Pmar_PMAR008261 [Perkinsus marinus ATCC 50983]|eukprot:XP_002772950.1 hypothetical protein Pmar_PMAR008261 [Perkinsus marinus ATCC 50983]
MKKMQRMPAKRMRTMKGAVARRRRRKMIVMNARRMIAAMTILKCGAVRKNREQFFEMMMELEQLKIEAQAADQLDKLAEALKKDESKRLKAFENKLKHRSEEYSENDGTKDKWSSHMFSRPVQTNVI